MLREVSQARTGAVVACGVFVEPYTLLVHLARLTQVDRFGDATQLVRAQHEVIIADAFRGFHFTMRVRNAAWAGAAVAHLVVHNHFLWKWQEISFEPQHVTHSYPRRARDSFVSLHIEAVAPGVVALAHHRLISIRVAIAVRFT